MPNGIIWYRGEPGHDWTAWSGAFYDEYGQEGIILAIQNVEDTVENLYYRTHYEFCVSYADRTSPLFYQMASNGNARSEPGVENGPIVWFRAKGADVRAINYLLTSTIDPAILEKDKTKGTKMIDVGIKREAGKLMLVVNAKDFHEELDKIGCVHANGQYLNRPATSVSVASNRFEMSTDCLLKREYPAKFDLTGIWSNVPTTAQLTQLCESAYATGRKILDHYQPIDISITIQKKIIK